MTADEQLRTQTRNAIRRSGTSQAEICRQLGLSTKHLSQMLTGKAPLTLLWAEGILNLIGMELTITIRPESTRD